MSIDWSGYTGEDKGYKSVKSGKQYVSEKTITDVWRYLHENNKYWIIDGISFTKEKTTNHTDFSRILYLSGSFVKELEHQYRLYGDIHMIYTSNSSSIWDQTSGIHESYTKDNKTVYYSYWDKNRESMPDGFELRVSSTVTYQSLEAAVNNYSEYDQEIGDNKNLAAWKVIFGDSQETSIGESMTDSEIINRLKLDTSIWNYHVIIGGKDYPYLPPLQ